MLKSLAYSSLPISLGAMAITLFYALKITNSIDLVTILINGLGTFIVYNLVQIIPIFINKKSSYKYPFFKKYLKVLIALMFLSSLGILFLIREIPTVYLWNYLHLFLLCLLYEAPGKFSLRNIPFFKTVLISYIWTMACVFPNYLAHDQSYSFLYLVEFFLYVLALSLAFDIRDIHDDQLRGFKTIINTFNNQTARFITIVIFAISLVFAFMLYPLDWKIFLYALLNLLILFNANEQRKYFYFLYYIDSLLFTKLLLI